MRFKKTDRPKSYPPEKVDAFVALARTTSITHAANKFNVAFCTIRNHLIKAGYKPRRPGNYTKEEALNIHFHETKTTVYAR